MLFCCAKVWEAIILLKYSLKNPWTSKKLKHENTLCREAVQPQVKKVSIIKTDNHRTCLCQNFTQILALLESQGLIQNT